MRRRTGGSPRKGVTIQTRKRTGWLLPALAIPLAVGLIAALLTRGGMGDYASLVKPPLAPPAWVFPAAWTVLYLLMGFASWRVAVAGADDGEKQEALSLYLVQLAANFLWPLLYFGLERRLAAFFCLLVLLVLVLLTRDRFRRIDRTAGALLVPYVLWLCFAAYLNLATVILNR